MDATELERRMERERLFWVEVAPGKRFQFLRPLLDETQEFVAGITMKLVCRYLRGWDGITEGDLVKAAGDEPVEYTQALATACLRDHLAWSKKVARTLGEVVAARAKATDTAEKNSEISST
jgi:hypothetical protein